MVPDSNNLLLALGAEATPEGTPPVDAPAGDLERDVAVNGGGCPAATTRGDYGGADDG